MGSDFKGEDIRRKKICEKEMGIQDFMEVSDCKCLVLKKTIYGLVQSARQFYVKLVKALKSCEFTVSLVDPSLWVKQSNTGIRMIAIYVDNCLNIRSYEVIKEVTEYLKKHDFGLNIEEDLKTT
jgi:hypothetical protein